MYIDADKMAVTKHFKSQISLRYLIQIRNSVKSPVSLRIIWE